MPGGRPRMVEASFLASFLGGLLSLLSPCSALLLPAFFAYAFQSRGELVGRTAVFYAGLCATLVPLGMGISAVSALGLAGRRPPRHVRRRYGPSSVLDGPPLGPLRPRAPPLAQGA